MNNEVMRLMTNLSYPDEMVIDVQDDDKTRAEKKRLSQKFATMYLKLIQSETIEKLARRLGKMMRGNMFVSILTPDAYFQFDNPSSKKYMNRIQSLGMLTFDSDVFTYGEPSQIPWYMQAYESYLKTKVHDWEYLYVDETQYGYCSGMLHRGRLHNLRRLLGEGKFKLPPLTTIMIHDGDYTAFVGAEEIDFDFKLVSKTSNVYFQPFTPPVDTIVNGILSKEKLIARGYPNWDDHGTFMPRHLKEDMQNYMMLQIVDNDFVSQTRDAHRVFKTLINLLKII